jgi:hypothetical protein
MTFWKNPWPEAVAVTLEELMACDNGIGKSCTFTNGETRILTLEDVLGFVKQVGPKLDAYVLPGEGQPGERLCMGVRYGNEPHEYLSPYGDQAKLGALLKKYQ